MAIKSETKTLQLTFVDGASKNVYNGPVNSDQY